ncbi:MAG: hypothetical protein HYX92_04135 [Chloroflexi bacterium]|nr:hypothetical protein [Chloroflexota bacterium]
MPTLSLFRTIGGVSVLMALLAGCAPAASPAPTIENVSQAPATPAPSAPKPAAPSAAAAATPAGPTPTVKPATEQPRYGGTLDRAHYLDPRSLDVHQESVPAAHLPLANSYNGLVKLDTVELTKVVSDLAEQWEVTPDGASWTFHLRKGVRWHDGKPFTVEDAKYSLERMAFWKEHKIVSPRGGALLSAVKVVEVLDENKVKVTLKYPSASFIANAAAGWVLILPKHVIQAKGDMKKDVIGTGPFLWKSYNPGVTIELAKNPTYFIKDRPYLDGIRFYIMGDAATRLAAFRTGRVKMTTLGASAISHVEAETVRKEMADSAVVQDYRAQTRFMFVSRITKAPWSDIRVRKAIDLAFDRQAAIKVNFNVGTVGAAMDPKGMWGIPEEEMKQRPGYRQPKDDDVAQAKRLMAEAGYPTGLKATMLTRSMAAHVRMATIAKDQLAKIGIDAEMDLQEGTVVEALWQRRAFEIAPTSFSDPLDDPDVALSSYYVTNGARNYADFSNKEIDELFEKQARTLDAAERRKLVRHIQERILDLAVYPVFYWDSQNLAQWKEVRGYKPLGSATHNSLVDVWLAK